MRLKRLADRKVDSPLLGPIERDATRASLFLGLLLVAGSFWLVWAYLHELHFDFLRSDVLSYWNDSLNWRRPFNQFHPPAYPLLIALIRGASFGHLSPLIIMRTISFTALLIGASLIFWLLCTAEVDRRRAVIGMLLFALWPFVGLVYVVFPIADSFAALLLLLGLSALRRSREWVAGLVFGLALIAHKAMWPFVGLILGAALLYSRKSFWHLLPPAIAPLTVLWVAGSFHHGSAGWILASDLRVEVISRSAFPILDGILGTLVGGGGKGILKASVVLAVAVVAAILAVLGYKGSTFQSRLSGSIALGTLFLCLVLNQQVIWGAVRFSRMLALPLIWSLGPRPWRRREGWLWLVVLAMSLMSQFAFAWYMAVVFFAQP